MILWASLNFISEFEEPLPGSFFSPVPVERNLQVSFLSHSLFQTASFSGRFKSLWGSLGYFYSGYFDQFSVLSSLLLNFKSFSLIPIVGFQRGVFSQSLLSQYGEALDFSGYAVDFGFAVKFSSKVFECPVCIYGGVLPVFSWGTWSEDVEKLYFTVLRGSAYGTLLNVSWVYAGSFAFYIKERVLPFIWLSLKAGYREGCFFFGGGAGFTFKGWKLSVFSELFSSFYTVGVSFGR